MCLVFVFFNDTATTEIYTLSLHDALPISYTASGPSTSGRRGSKARSGTARSALSSSESDGSPESRRTAHRGRSEEHTSELQSRQYLVCRLLLEKKKNIMHRTASLTLIRIV